jgi:hypothetical protein
MASSSQTPVGEPTDCSFLTTTVGAIYIGAANSIGAALFAKILEHLQQILLTFSFRIIYFRMLRIRIFFKKRKKYFLLGPYFEFFLK